VSKRRAASASRSGDHTQRHVRAPNRLAIATAGSRVAAGRLNSQFRRPRGIAGDRAGRDRARMNLLVMRASQKSYRLVHWDSLRNTLGAEDVDKDLRSTLDAALMRSGERDLIDSLDEAIELEMEDTAFDGLGEDDPVYRAQRRDYFKNLFRLQSELVKLQDWVAGTKQKVIILFEGRDAAGKGGVIKRITQRLNPRVCRVVALPAPNDRERTQWYFQRYVTHLPAAGEMVLFDRSWYNRAGVERVMNFCSEADVEEFFRSVPEFERMLVRSGIRVFKYWFSITDEEQHARFLGRLSDPLKQWKFSPMDLESRRRWEDYTKAKEAMLERTHIPEAPWWVVQAVDKRKARLNCIQHLLSMLPYHEMEHPTIELPARLRKPDYSRRPVPREMFVPEVY
jgi:polyphosphate kinase 2